MDQIFTNKEKVLKIELIGIGSAKHRQLKANLEQAMEETGVHYPVTEISELERLLTYKIGGIPALVINGKIAFEKVVPSVTDLKLLLEALLAHEQMKKDAGQLLVPTDFSTTSENAFRYALAMADVMDTSVGVVHVEPIRTEILGPHQKRAPKAIEKQVRKAMLEAFVNKQNTESEIAHTLLEGPVVEELIRLADAPEVEMVVMGMTGEQGLIKKWIGSVSAKVAKEANKPVLLVPTHTKFSKLRHIVYASDYHPHERQVLPDILKLAEWFGATIHFLHINAKNPTAEDQQVTGSFPVNGYFLEYARVDNEDVISGLTNFAEQVNADLVVMSTARRSFVEELFHRSMTQKMVLQSRRPILITHIGESR